MALLADRRILFIHIPKTAGTYLRKNLKESFETEWDEPSDPKHVPLADLYRRCKDRGFDISKLYTISLVRNPWSKLYSTWKFFGQLQYKEYFSGDIDIDKDFNKWLKWTYSNNYDRSKTRKGLNLWRYVFNNQLNWFKSSDNEDYKIDKIIKMENLDDEIVPLAREVGMKRVFKGRENAQRYDIPYNQVYNQESIDLVAKHFAEDIKTFDYNYQQL